MTNALSFLLTTLIFLMGGTSGSASCVRNYQPQGGLNQPLKTVTEGSSGITRTYDERSRLKTYTNADGEEIKYQYDANNNLTRLTYPPDTTFPAGRQVNYTYNARNQLETVIDWSNRVTTYQHDRLGRLTGTIRPNGTSNQIAHDAAGQLLFIKESANGKLISYLNFKYDVAGQVTKRFRAPLVNTGWKQPIFTATYDDDNRLATVNGQNVSIDPDGNMTNGPIKGSANVPPTWINLTYNSRNQLTNADGITYTYDAEGIRRTQTDSTGTTRDVSAPGGQLLIRHHADGSKTYYVYGLGLLYEANEADATKTYHFDQVGSTIARTDDSGKVIGQMAYSPYGLIMWKHGDMDTPFQYNGQVGVQTDANGLLNMWARFYSPYLMRFLNADPSGFSGGSNWFSYADGNPISKNDPFGLWAGVDDAVFSGVGAIVGVGGKFFANTLTGTTGTWEDYAGAAIGGAAGGESLLYTANPFVAGAVGGSVTNTSTQGFKLLTGKQDSFSTASLAVDTAIGTATGFIPGYKIPGISSGTNSSAAIFQQMVTKFGNRTIDNVTTKTATKMVTGAFVKYAAVEGAALGNVASDTFGTYSDYANQITINPVGNK